MNKKLVKNVGIILGCSIAAKVLSYIWEALIAAYLGASDQADALYMVTSIFGILYPILDLGIWKVFLPIYKTKLVEKDDQIKIDGLKDLINISEFRHRHICSWQLPRSLVQCCRAGRSFWAARSARSERTRRKSFLFLYASDSWASMRLSRQ